MNNLQLIAEAADPEDVRNLITDSLLNFERKRKNDAAFIFTRSVAPPEL